MTVELEALRDSWLRSLRSRNKAPKTIRTYKEAADALIEFINNPPADARQLLAEHPVSDAPDVKRSHIEAFMAELVAHHKPLTAVNRYSALQQWFKWMTEEPDLIEFSPMTNTRRPTVPEQTIPVVSISDIKAVLATCKGKGLIDLRDEAIIRLFCDTGIRLSELTGLKTADMVDGERVPHIDLDAQVIWVLGKGRRWRAITFGDRTAVTLDRYMRARRKHRHAASEHVWLGARGRRRIEPMTVFGIYQMVKRRCDAAGVPRIHPHQFRHTWAHTMKVKGMDRGDLKRQGGWKSDQMVDRYGSSAADERSQAAHRRYQFGDEL